MRPSFLALRRNAAAEGKRHSDVAARVCVNSADVSQRVTASNMVIWKRTQFCCRTVGLLDETCSMIRESMHFREDMRHTGFYISAPGDLEL